MVAASIVPVMTEACRSTGWEKKSVKSLQGVFVFTSGQILRFASFSSYFDLIVAGQI